MCKANKKKRESARYRRVQLTLPPQVNASRLQPLPSPRRPTIEQFGKLPPADVEARGKHSSPGPWRRGGGAEGAGSGDGQRLWLALLLPGGGDGRSNKGGSGPALGLWFPPGGLVVVPGGTKWGGGRGGGLGPEDRQKLRPTT